MIKIWQEEYEGAEIPYVENDTHGTLNGTRDTQNAPQGGLRGEELDEWIAYQLAVHPKMTTEELASLSGKEIRTIKRHISDMKRLRFAGNGSNGHWLVGLKVEKTKSPKGGQVSGLLNEIVQKLVLFNW